MRCRRGLTLIEVLIATLLLTMVAATCVPLLARAGELLSTPPATLGIDDLVDFADAILKQPTDFGLAEIHQIGPMTIPWPEPDREPVHIQIVDAGTTANGHVWIIFQSEGIAISRWFALPVEPATNSESPS